MKEKKYTVLVFVDKEASAYALVERDITQRLEYKNARSSSKHEHEWTNTARTYNAFSMTFKNPNGTKIVYKWRKNGFTIEQIEDANVIITDNFTTVQDLRQWLADCDIDKLVLVE